MSPRAPRDLRFVALWSASTATMLGDWVLAVSVPLAVLGFTHTPWVIGALIALVETATVALSTPAGILADRHDRARVTAGSCVIGALSAAGVSGVLASHRGGLPAMIAGVWCAIAASAVVAAVCFNTIPDVVDDRGLARANSFVGGAEMGSELVGLALGAALFGAGRWLPGAGDGASFLLCAPLLAMASAGRRTEIARPAVAGPPRLRTALATLRAERFLQLQTTTVALCSLTQGGVFALVAVYLTRILHVGTARYGLLLSVAALAGVATAPVGHRIHARLGSVAVTVVAIGTVGAGYIVLAAAFSPWLAVVGLAGEYIGVTLANMTSAVERALRLPAEIRGTANGVSRTVIAGAYPLGALIGGSVASLIGVREEIAASGVLTVACAVGLALPLERASHLGPLSCPGLPTDAAPEELHG